MKAKRIHPTHKVIGYRSQKNVDRDHFLESYIPVHVAQGVLMRGETALGAWENGAFKSNLIIGYDLIVESL